MRIVRTAAGWIVAAPAKINVFLELLGKRSDGYHEIATLMVGVSLRDTLAFVDDPAGEITLSCDRPDLSTGPDNLIVKAAELLRSRAGVTRGARIRLRKRIPMAAGLAGGSTDAVATLVGLNRLWNLGLPSSELAGLSARLGSDLPFFFSLPAAWCTGRGEVIEPVAAPQSFDVVLILPPFGCGTAEVYRNVSLTGPTMSGEAHRSAMAAGDIESLGRLRDSNRLEPAAMKVAPGLIPIREATNRVAPFGCTMSGSGSTLFAIVRSRHEASETIARLRRLPELAGCGFRAVRTMSN